MKIYTRTGDKGSTGLFGGTRLPKSDARLHAYGTLDELNACLGVIVADKTLPAPLPAQLTEIQVLLFSLGSDLATPLSSKAKVKRMDESPAAEMERWIDAMELELPSMTKFILPGGSHVGALLHQARTICRRAERWMVDLHAKDPITLATIVIVNRLSDYLFVAARYANTKLGMGETEVDIPRG